MTYFYHLYPPFFLFVAASQRPANCRNKGVCLAMPKTARTAQTHKSTSFILIVSSTLYVPYARHYNPRFVLFLPHFSFTLRFILLTIYICTKNKNSSFFKLKIRGLYTRAVSDQERVIMARVRYIKMVSHISTILV